MLKRKVFLAAALSAGLFTQVTKPDLQATLDKVGKAIDGVGKVLTDVTGAVTAIGGTVNDMKGLVDQFNAAQKVSQKIQLITLMNTSILESLDSLVSVVQSAGDNVVSVFDTKAGAKMDEVVTKVGSISGIIVNLNVAIAKLVPTIAALEAFGA